MSPRFVDHFRKIRDAFIAKFEYESAVFISENLIVSVGRDDEQLADDVERLCDCFFQLKEFHRAISIIESKPAALNHLGCLCLLIKCYLKIKKLDKGIALALETLERCSSLGEESKSWKCTLHYLLGELYLTKDNQFEAIVNYEIALEENFCCFQVFFSLVDRHLISLKLQHKLLNRLMLTHAVEQPFTAAFMRFFYSIIMSKHTRPDDLQIYSPFEVFLENSEVLAEIAERHYYNCDYLTAMDTVETIVQNDHYHMKAVLIRVACLIEDKKSNELCVLGQNLINLYPEHEISWYILGCYYHLLNKPALARSFLLKATMINVHFAPAWLLCGHSFSQIQEHDQAISAFLRASHYLPACHLPLLYVGIEYILTDNYKLAEKYVSKALELAPEDPITLHELGIIAFHTNEIFTAERHFRNALKFVMYSEEAKQRISLRYLSLFNNMGHVLRKLGKYQESIEFHSKVLEMSPHYMPAHFAIGFVYSMTEQWTKATKHLDITLENHLLAKDINSLTETLLDGHVLKQFCESFQMKLELGDDKFTDQDMVEELANKAPIDLLSEIAENHKNRRIQRSYSMMNIDDL